MNARLFLLKQYDNGDFEIVVSFDEFNDFEERGEVFKKWVMELV